MDWLQFVIFVFTIGGLSLWMKTESRADHKALEARMAENRIESRADREMLEAKMAENRKETNSILQAIQQESKDFHREIKDFHGRLCSLEERYLQFKMNQK